MELYFSHWIILMIIFLALLIVFAKRRNKDGCNPTFMNQVISILASMTIVCYMMYTVSPDVIERFHSRYLYITNIFVIVGIIRYLQIIFVEVKNPSHTDVLLKDHFIQLCIIGLGITFCLLHCLAVSCD
jgi:glucan phosphoethanolaminetransferase (alkaline phosphatase superfamily)